MLIKGLDWMIGDRVKVKIGDPPKEYTGEIIGWSLTKMGSLLYTIKVSDTESIAASSKRMRPIK